MATMSVKQQEQAAQQKRLDKLSEIDQPKTFDVFDLATSGLPPGQIASILTRNDKLEFHEPEYYMNRFAEQGVLDKLNPNDLEDFRTVFNQRYDESKRLHEDINRVLPKLPSSVIKEFMPYGKLAEPAVNYFEEEKPNPFIVYTGYDGKMEYPSITERNQAALRNFFVDIDANGKETRVERPVTKRLRKDPWYRFYQHYDIEGKYGEPGQPYYVRRPFMEEDYAPRASIYGEVPEDAMKFMDPIFGLLSGVIPMTLGSAASLGEVLTTIPNKLIEKAGIKPPEILNNFFKSARKGYERMEYEPSEKTRELGFTGGFGQGRFGGLAYAFGEGFGMLIPQMLPGFGLAGKSKGILGSLPRLTPKQAMALSAGIGTMQADADIFQSAKEAGLGDLQSALFAAAALPAVYATERVIAAPYLTRRFARNESKALIGEMKDAILKKQATGADMSDNAVMAATIKRGLGKYYGKIARNAEKLKSGEMGFDQLPFVPGMLREGTQETLEEIYYIAQEMGYDRIFGRRNEPGMGNFGSLQEGYGEDVKKRLLESAVGGALLGGVVSSFSSNKKREHQKRLETQILLENGTEKGKKMIFDDLNLAYNKNELGTDNTLFDGTILTVEKKEAIESALQKIKNPETSEEEREQAKTSLPFGIELTEDVGKLSKGDFIYTQKDVVYYNTAKEVENLARLIDVSGLDYLETIDQINTIKDNRLKEGLINYHHNHTLATLDVALALKSKKEEVDTLRKKLQGGEAEVSADQVKKINEDIQVAEKEIDNLSTVLDERTKPEKGTNFPKMYNDFARMQMAASSYAKEKTTAEMKGEVAAVKEEEKKNLHYLDRLDLMEKEGAIDPEIIEIEDQMKKDGEILEPAEQPVEEQPMEADEEINKPEKAEIKSPRRTAGKVLGKLIPNLDNILNKKIEDREKRLNLFIGHYNDWLKNYKGVFAAELTEKYLNDEIEKLRNQADLKDQIIGKGEQEINQLLADAGQNLEFVPEEEVEQYEEVDDTAPFVNNYPSETVVSREGEPNQVIRNQIEVKDSPDGATTESYPVSYVENEVSPVPETMDDGIEERPPEVEAKLPLAGEQLPETEEKLPEAAGELIPVSEEIPVKEKARTYVEPLPPILSLEDFLKAYENRIDEKEVKKLKKEKNVKGIAFRSLVKPKEGKGEGQLSVDVVYNSNEKKDLKLELKELEPKIVKVPSQKPLSAVMSSNLNEILSQLGKMTLPAKVSMPEQEQKVPMSDVLVDFVRKQTDKIQAQLKKEDPEMAELIDIPLEDLTERGINLANEVQNHPVAKGLTSAKSALDNLVKKTVDDSFVSDIPVSTLTRKGKDQKMLDAEDVELRKNKKVQMSAYVNRFKGLIDEIKMDADKGFEKYGNNLLFSSVLENLVQDLGYMQEIGRINSEVLYSRMQHGPDPVLNQYIRDNDYPLPTELWNDKISKGEPVSPGIRTQLSKMQNTAREILSKFNDSSLMESNREINLHLRDIELGRMLVTYLTEKLNLLQEMPELGEWLSPENLPVFTMEERDKTAIDTPELRERIKKGMRALHEISTLLYHNREKFVSQSSIDRVITELFKPLMSNANAFYTSPQDYGLTSFNYPQLIDRISPEMTNLDKHPLFMVQLANFLQTALYMDPESLASANQNAMQDLAEQPRTVGIPISEQLNASNQITVFLHNGQNEFITKLINKQFEWSIAFTKQGKEPSSAEIKSRKAARDTILSVYRTTNLVVPGDLATGKTMVVLRMAIQNLLLLNPKKKYRIGIFAHTSHLRNDIVNNLSGLENIELVPINKRDGFKSHKNIDFLVWDEIGLAQIQDMKKMNNANPGLPILGLGDQTQMTQFNRNYEGREMAYFGARTKPLSKIHSTQISVLQDIIWFYRKLLINPNATFEEPILYEDKISTNTEGIYLLKGGRYYSNVSDVIEAYFARAASDKALIFPTYESVRKFAEKNPRIFDEKGRIYVLESDYETEEGGIEIKEVNGKRSMMVDSIQGLRENEVYLAFDRTISELNPGLPSLLGRAFYTATGRARRYVALVGFGGNASSKDQVAWYDPEEDSRHERIPKNKETSRYQNWMDYFNSLGLSEIEKPVLEKTKVSEEKVKEEKPVFKKNDVVQISDESRSNPGALMRVESVVTFKNGKTRIYGHLLNSDFTPVLTEDGSIISISEQFKDVRHYEKDNKTPEKKKGTISSSKKKIDTLSIDTDDIISFAGTPAFMIDAIEQDESGEEIIRGHLVDNTPFEVKTAEVKLPAIKDNPIDEREPTLDPVEIVTRYQTAQGARTISRIEEMQMEKAVLWGTTYTAFHPDRLTTKEEREDLRRIYPIISGVLQSYKVQLEYRKKTSVYNDRDGSTLEGPAFLVKIDDKALASIKSYLKDFLDRNGQLDKKTREAVGRALDGNYDDMLKYVSALQTSNINEGSKRILERLEAIAKDSKQDVFVFVDQKTGLPYNLVIDKILPGKLIRTPRKRTNSEVFVRYLEGLGYAVDDHWEWKPSFINTSSGAFIKKFHNGSVEGYLIGKAPRMQELTGKNLRDHFEADWNKIKNAKSRSELNSQLANTYLIAWLRTNRSMFNNQSEEDAKTGSISTSLLGKELVSYGLRIMGKKYYFGEDTDPSVENEKAAILAFMNDISNDWSDSATKNIRNSYQPIFASLVGQKRIAGNKIDYGRKFINPDLEVDYGEIHAPSIYLNVDPLMINKPEGKTVINNETKRPDLNASRQKFRGGTKKNLIITHDSEERTTTKAKAEDLIGRILGRNEAIDYFGFDPFIDNAESILAGQMSNGLIRLRETEDGLILAESPRHEIFHKIFNYGLSSSMQNRLVNDWRDQNNQPELNFGEVEERMAKEYGLMGDSAFMAELPTSLWGKMKRFLERILVRLKLYNKDFTSLIRDMESGLFADIHFNIDSQSDIIRNLEHDSSRIEEEIKELGLFENSVLLRNTFNTKPRISEAINYLGYQINVDTVFENEYFNNPDSQYVKKSPIEAIDEVYDFFVTQAEKVKNNSYNGTLVKNMDFMQMSRIENNDAWYDYLDYKLADPDVFKAVLRKIFPDYRFDEKKFVKHGKEQYDDVEMHDPKSYLSSMLRYQIRITELMKWDSKNNQFLSDPEGGIKFIGDNEIYPSLGRAAVRAKEILKRGESNNFIDAFTSVLKEEANTISVDNNKKDVIMSFVHRWLEDQEWDGSVKSTKSFRQEVERLLSTSQYGDAENELIKLFNAFITHFANYGQLKTTDYKVFLGKDNELHVKVDNRITDSINQEKIRIKDQLRNAIMDGHTNEPKRYIVDKIKAGPKQVWEVASDGLYYRISKSRKIKLIDISGSPDNAVYSLVEDNGLYTLDHSMINAIRYLFGLRSVKSNVWTSLRDGKNPELKNFMASFTGLNFAEYNYSQQLLTSGIYNMFLSMKLYGDLRSRVYKETVKIKEQYGETNKDEFDNRIIGITNSIIKDIQKGEEYQRLLDYMVKSNEMLTLDPSQNMMSNDLDEYNDQELPFPTPVSFFNFFNLLAKVKTFYSSDPSNNFINAYDNTRRYAMVTNSSLSRSFENGSSWMPGFFEKAVVKDGKFDRNNPSNINPEVLNSSPVFTIRNGKVEILNPLYDREDPMQILEMRTGTSIAYNKATGDPNISDRLLMTISSFIEGIKKRSEHIIVPTINLSNTGKLMFFDSTFDNSWRKRLFNKPPRIEDGSFQDDLRLADDLLDDKVMKAFEMTYRLYQVRAKMLYDFMQEDPLLKSYMQGLSKTSSDPRLFSQKIQNIFDEIALNNENDYIQLKERLTESRLLQNFDYLIDKGKISVGNAIRMDDNILNFNNYQSLTKSSNPTLTRKKIFYDELESLVNKLIDYSSVLPNQLRGMLSDNKKEMLYKFEDIQKEVVKNGKPTIVKTKGKEKIFNPIIEGWFYSYWIVNSFAGPIALGSPQGSENEEMRSRGSRTTITPKVHLVKNLNGLGEQFRIINIKQEYLVNPRGVESGIELKMRNGMAKGIPFTMEFVYQSLGDEYGFTGRTAQKPLIDYINPITYERFKYKEAMEVITEDSYNKSPYNRKIIEAALDHTTEMVRREDPSFTRDLHAEFLALKGNIGFDRAVKEFVKAIRMDKVYGKLIVNNLVLQVANPTLIKEGVTLLNDFDPSYAKEGKQGAQMTSMTIPVDEVGFILDPSQDVERIDHNVVKPNQLFAYLGTAINQNRIVEIDRIMSQIYQLAEENFKDELRSIKVPSEVKGLDRHIFRMSEFLRGRGLNILDKVDVGGNFSTVILNKNISLDFPGVRDLVIFSFRNYLNENLINTRMNGVRHTQLDGSDFLIFRDNDGNRYAWDEMESMVGNELTLNDLEGKSMTQEEVLSRGREYTYTFNGIKYSVTRPQPMLPGQKGEVFIPFSQIKQFGLRPDQHLNDLFTLHYLNNKPSVNVRNMPMDKVRKLVRKGLKNGSIDSDRTLFLKMGQGFWENYITGAKKILDNVYNSRVPLNRIGSGDVNEVVDFINDSGNVIYLPPEKPALDDSDYDIDAKSVYFFKLDKTWELVRENIDGYLNEVLDHIIDVYTDPAETKSIFFSSSVDELKMLRDEAIANKINHTANSLTTWLDHSYMNEVGTDSIGIYAVGASALGYLAKMRNNLVNLAPGFSRLIPLLGHYGKSNPIIMIGDLLQSALDNEKLNILSPLGLTRDAAPIAIGMVATGSTFREIKDFFTDPVIAKIFKQIAKRHSILESYKDFIPYNLIQDAIEERELKLAGKNIIPSAQAKAEIEKIVQSYYNEEEVLDVEEKLAEIEPVMNEEDRKRLYDLQNVIDFPEQIAKLNKLLEYFVLGESLYRLGRAISLRNGMKVLEYEHNSFNEDFSLYLGMDRRSWLTNKTVSHKEQMDFWEKNNGIYRYFPISSRDPYKDQMRKERMRANEEKVREALNLPEVIRQMPAIKKYVDAQMKNNDYLSNVFLPYSDWSQKAAAFFQDMVEQKGWRYAKQYGEFKKQLDHVFADYFFKNAGDKVSVKMPIAVEKVGFDDQLSGDYFVPESFLQDLDLSKTEDQVKFRIVFPRFFDFLQEAVEDTSYSGSIIVDQATGRKLDNGEKRFYTAGLDYSWLADLRKNYFFESLSLEGESGSEYIQMKDGRKMNPDEIGFLKEGFEQMPSELQLLFQFNQIISRGFQYTKGTISDVVGTGIYPEISKALNGFNQFIKTENIFFNGINSAMLMEEFIKTLGTESMLVPYLSEDAEVTSGKKPRFSYRYEKVRSWLSRRQTRFHPTKGEASIPFYRKYPRLFDVGSSNTTVYEVTSNFGYEDLEQLEKSRVYLSSDQADLVAKGLQTSVIKIYPRSHGYKNNAIYFFANMYLRAKTSNTAVRFGPFKTDENDLKAEALDLLGTEADNFRKRKLELEKEIRAKNEAVEQSEKRLEEEEKVHGLGMPYELDETGMKIYYNPSMDTEVLEREQGAEELQQREFTGGTTRAEKAFARIEKKRMGQKAMQHFMNFIEQAYGLKFVADLEHINSDGSRSFAWIMPDGVHYDESRINMAMPLHEMNHIWLEVLRKSDPEMYEALLEKARSYRGSEFYKAIEKKYAGANDVVLDKEFLATMTGFYSYDIFESWLMKNGIEVDNQGFWSDVKRWAKSVLDRVLSAIYGKRYFNPESLGSLNLRHLLRQFSLSVLNGEIQIDKDVLQEVLQGVYQFESREFGNRPAVGNIKDIVPYFLNGSDAIFTTGFQDADKFADELMNRNLIPRDGNIQVNIGPYRYEVKYSEDKAIMKKRILEEIVQPTMQREENFGDLVVDVIRTFITGDKEAFDSAVEIFNQGDTEHAREKVYDILFYTGAREDVDQVLRYEDLKTSANPLLRALYKPGFEGMNPVIIVHNINSTNGEVVISMIDPTMLSMGYSQSIALERNTLTAAFQSSRQFKSMGGSMNNSIGDLRRFMLGLQMIAMSDGNKVKVRNHGVLGIQKELKVNMTSDMNELLDNIRIVGQQKVFTDMISNNDVLKALTDELLLGKDYNQPFVDRMKMYYKDLRNVGKLKNSPIDLFGENVSDADLRDMIVWRMNILNKSKLNSEYNAESQMLSMALYQIETHDTGWINRLDQMSKEAKRFIAAHNVKHPVYQFLRDRLLSNIDKVVSLTDQAQKELSPYLNDVIKFYHHNNGLAFLDRYMRDIGSKYFARLWKESIVYDKTGNIIKDKKGNPVKRKIPEIYWNANDPQTARKLANGELSHVELKLANKLLDMLEERWIKNEYHNEMIAGSDKTFEDIKREFYMRYQRGWVPAIGKKGGELISELNAKAGFRATIDRWGRSENLFVGDLTLSSNLERLSSHFHNQHRNEQRLRAAGLEYFGVDEAGNAKYMVIDDLKNQTMSLNLQDITNYTLIEGIRKEVYENEFLPDYNAAKTIMTMIEMQKRGPAAKKQHEGYVKSTDEQFMEEWVNRLVFQQNADYGVGKARRNESVALFRIAGYDVGLNDVVRSLLQGFTFLTLAFKPTIWLMSALYNTIAMLSMSISNQIVQGINSHYGQAPANLFTAKDLGYGFTQLLTPSGFQKAWKLARALKIVEGTERDLLNSPLINKTAQNLLKGRIAHIGNWATDAFAKTWVMVAQMHHEGSYDAYSLGDKTGEIIYNVKKDKRFYSNGIELTANGEKAIRLHIMNNLIRQGVMKQGEGMKLGHDALLSDNFRWISDKFVIGSMTPTSKWLLSNHYVGMIFGNLRSFTVDKLNNAGVFADGWLVKSGSNYKAVKDGDVWITSRDAQMIEGIWKSNILGYYELIKIHRFNGAKWWQDMSYMRKLNIAKSVVNLVMFSLLKVLITGIPDRRLELRFSSLYKDLALTFVLGDFMRSPFGVISTAIRMFNIAFGDQPNKFNKFARFVPGYEFAMLPQAIVNFFDQENMKVLQEKKEKRKEQRQARAESGFLVGSNLSSDWQLVEDLAGLPKHSEGGIDLMVDNGKVMFTGKEGMIHAKNGLVIK